MIGEKTAGSTGDDIIMGGKGKDKIGGGLTKDVLIGGKGRDTFVFSGLKKLVKKHKDLVKDYNVKQDRIWLENDMFKANKSLYKAIKKGTDLRPKKLKNSFFSLDEAKDANDYFVYDTQKRVLYYDKDGSGSAKAVDIASFKNNKALKGFSANELFFI